MFKVGEKIYCHVTISEKDKDITYITPGIYTVKEIENNFYDTIITLKENTVKKYSHICFISLSELRKEKLNKICLK